MKAEFMDVALFGVHLKNKNKPLADSSAYEYIKVAQRFLALDPDLDKLEDYNAFLIKYTQKKRCSHYYSVLKSLIEYKISDGNLRNRLIDGLIKPTIRKDTVKERKYLDEDKLFDVINNLDREKHRIITLIQSLTGVRAGDVLRLRQGGIVPEEYEGKPVLRLNIRGKGEKRNVIYIHDEVAQQIIMQYITKQSDTDDIEKINLYRKINQFNSEVRTAWKSDVFGDEPKLKELSIERDKLIALFKKQYPKIETENLLIDPKDKKAARLELSLPSSAHKDYYFIELGTCKTRVGQPDNENMLVKMNYLWLWKDLKQALNVVGISKEDFATHDFRRCFARRVWTKWKDIHVLQGLLNHSDPKTTLRYLNQSGLKNIDYHKQLQS